MKEKRTRGVWIVAVMVLLLGPPALYASGYLAMLDSEKIVVGFDPEYTPTSQNPPTCLLPCYRFGDQWADFVFYPAWSIDRRLRLARWE